MSKIPEPHPGVEVCVIDGIAHRVRFNVAQEKGGPYGIRWKQDAFAVCSGELGKALSFGSARTQGAVACDASDCYPGGRRG